MTVLVESQPAAWAVPLAIHRVEEDGTTGDEIVDRFGLQLQVIRHGEWAVSWSAPAASSEAQLPRRARIRVILELGDDRAVLFDAVVRRRRRVLVSPDEEAGLNWSFTAYEKGYDYAKRRIKVYPAGPIYEPPGGVEAFARRGWEPFSATRTFGWPDPSYDFDAHGATAAVELWQQSNPLPFPYGRSAAPFGWLDNTAWWIWDRAIVGLAHPAGTIYGDGEFTLAAETKLIIDSAGDDAYELWLNGVLVTARAMAEDGSTWTRLARTEVTVGPGVHHLRFSCTNEGGGAGNIGGFICAVYDQADGTLITHTDSSWRVIGYPAEIGQTPGEILGVLIGSDPQARGMSYPDDVPSVTFGAVYDSNENLWPVIAKWPVNVGRPVQEAIDQMAATFIEYQWSSGLSEGPGHVLHAWTAEGVTVAGGGTAPDPAVFYEPGTLVEGMEGNVRELTVDESTEDEITDLLYMWGRGYSEITPALSLSPDLVDAAAEAGRHEGFLPIGDIDDPSAAWVTAYQNLMSSYQPRVQVTGTMSDGVGRYRDDVPMLHYFMHNTVLCYDMDNPTLWQTVRLVGVTIRENDKTGVMEMVPTWATKIELWLERIQRWLQRQTLSPQNGLTDAASPDSPSILNTTIVESQHETFSGDTAEVDAVGTPWNPTETVAVTQALARSEETGGSTSTVSLTVDGFPTSPLRTVSIAGGEKAGFAQFNGAYLLIVTRAQAANIKVTADGGHEKISVDVFFAPYPFAS